MQFTPTIKNKLILTNVGVDCIDPQSKHKIKSMSNNVGVGVPDDPFQALYKPQIKNCIMRTKKKKGDQL